MSRSVFDSMELDVQGFVDRPGRRLPVSLSIPGGGETDDELRIVVEMAVEGEAFAQLSTLYLVVHIAAQVRQPCRRCLAPVMTTVELDEEFEVPILPGVDTVDLRPDVLRLVLSAHDPNVLCRNDCRGLCPVCGVNLNREPNHTCQTDDEPLTLRSLASWTNDS